MDGFEEWITLSALPTVQQHGQFLVDQGVTEFTFKRSVAEVSADFVRAGLPQFAASDIAHAAHKHFKKIDERSHQPLGIFWDVENVGISKFMSGAVVCQRMLSALAKFGKLEVFNAYGDANCSMLSAENRSNLQLSGCHILDTPHVGRTEVADKMIIVDAMLFAMKHCAAGGASICLITGDADFAYMLSKLSQFPELRTILVTKSNVRLVLRHSPTHVFSWERDILGEDAEAAVNSAATVTATTTATMPTAAGIKKSSPPRTATGSPPGVARLSPQSHQHQQHQHQHQHGAPNRASPHRHEDPHAKRTTTPPKHKSAATAADAPTSATAKHHNQNRVSPSSSSAGKRHDAAKGGLKSTTPKELVIASPEEQEQIQERLKMLVHAHEQNAAATAATPIDNGDNNSPMTPLSTATTQPPPSEDAQQQQQQIPHRRSSSDLSGFPDQQQQQQQRQRSQQRQRQQLTDEELLEKARTATFDMSDAPDVDVRGDVRQEPQRQDAAQAVAAAASVELVARTHVDVVFVHRAISTTLHRYYSSGARQQPSPSSTNNNNNRASISKSELHKALAKLNPLRYCVRRRREEAIRLATTVDKSVGVTKDSCRFFIEREL